MAGTYLDVATGGNGLQQKIAIREASGGDDSDVLVRLNASGKVDVTLLPSAALGGETTKAIVASESVSAGDLVNVFNDSGTLKVRKATAASTPKPAVGIADTSGGIGDSITVRLGRSFDVTDTSHGFAIGVENPIFLSAATPGAMTQTAPSGVGVGLQRVGYATDANTIQFEPGDVIVLAE